MQFSVLLCVCILILAATSALDAACARMRVSPWGAAFTALCVVTLSRFTVSPCPEFILDAAAGFLPVYLLLGAILRHEKILEQSPVLLLAASVAYAACAALIPQADRTLLLCAGAALVAAFLRESPLFAMFAASLVPLVGSILFACYELYAFGYASCDLNAPYVLDAQMAGLISTALACYFFGAHKAQPENS